MKKRSTRTPWWPIAFLSLFLLLVFSIAAQAATTINPVQVRRGDSADIPADSIILEKHAGSGYGIDISAKGGTITGGSVTISGDFPGIRVSPSSRNVGAKAVLSLDRLDMQLTDRTGIFANAPEGPADIFLGDDSKITAGHTVLDISSGANLTMGKNAELRANGENGNVISARNGIVELGENAYVERENYTAGKGNVAVAALADSGQGRIVIGDGSTVLSSSLVKNSHALQAGSAAGSGDITVGKNANVSTAGEAAYALYNNAAGSRIQTGEGSVISTKGDGSFALFGNAADSVIQTGEGSVISTKGNDSFALFGNAANSSIQVGEGSAIRTTGAGATAVRAGFIVNAQETPGGTILLDKNTTVGASGDKAYGIEARGAGSAIEMKAGSSIETSGENGYGAVAAIGGTVGLENVSVTTSGNSALGLLAGGYVKLKKGLLGNLTIMATEPGIIDVKDGITVTTTGENAHGVAASFGGQVNLCGDVNVTVDSSKGAYAIGAAGRSRINNGDSPVVAGSGVFHVNGDIGAVMGGQVGLMMQEGSQFTGATRIATFADITDPKAVYPMMDDQLAELLEKAGDSYKNMEKGTSLDLAMTKSQWNMTGASNLSSLTLDDSVVDMTPAQLGSVLSADSLSGSGSFIIKTDIAALSADKIVAASSDGSHKLTASNQGGETVTGDEVLTVVETGDGVAEFSMDNDVSVGAWLYGLRRSEADANNWELYGKEIASPVGNAAVSTFSGAYLLSYAETQTLMQRLGDLRDAPYLSGLWFRVYGGKMESNSSSFVREFDMDYGGVQVGYDRKIENNLQGDTYVGGFFGYGKGDLDYSSAYGNTGGSGTVDAKTLGAYATYVQDDGFYADALVKYMWMENGFDTLDTDGEKVTGDDVSTGGLGISLELGKRFRMAKNDKGGNWYVEPQIQYSYTHQDGGYFNASNGLRIGVDEFTSSMGRLGVLVGYETSKTNFYAKASFVKEFDGDVNIAANDANISESFGDSWWVYGLGFTSKLNDRNSVYMSLERSEGGRFEEPWKVYAGWRINL